ncbi:MAG: STAS/SEC14 domain-containing protein [Anaerolineae bacterium]|nr:STAS/SEC14 domain-containing protein [Anaerolineae bacterium]
MANYVIECLLDLPVVMVTYQPGYGGDEDIAAFADAVIDVFENLDYKAYLMFNMSSAKLSFNDIMQSAQRILRSENSPIKHPNFIALGMITDSKMFRTVAKGLNSAAFGNIKVQVFATRDEALAWARMENAKRSG